MTYHTPLGGDFGVTIEPLINDKIIDHGIINVWQGVKECHGLSKHYNVSDFSGKIDISPF
jgi:hypothetical protein